MITAVVVFLACALVGTAMYVCSAVGYVYMQSLREPWPENVKAGDVR